jgi:hypothetical protein
MPHDVDDYGRTPPPPQQSAEQFLKDLRVDYQKQPDGTLVVPGDLDISGKGLTRLPDLSSVAVLGDFDCHDNHLTDLKGSPKSVGGDYNCQSNDLKDLSGITKSIRGDILCQHNSGENFRQMFSMYTIDDQLREIVYPGKKVLDGPISYRQLKSDYGHRKSPAVAEAEKQAAVEAKKELVGKQATVDAMVTERLFPALMEGPRETIGWIRDYARTTGDDYGLDGKVRDISSALKSVGYKSREFEGDPRRENDPEIMARYFVGQVIELLDQGKRLYVPAIEKFCDKYLQTPGPPLRQDRINDLVDNRLPETVNRGLAATVKWIGEYAEATENRGIDNKKQKVIDTLTTAGYKPGEFVGDQRGNADMQIKGRYIVGQVLSCLNGDMPLPQVTAAICNNYLKMSDGQAPAAHAAQPKA